MKTLLQLFLWTCTALLLGLMIILAMATAKGHFNTETITKIVALLNGIDIQGERLRQAVEQGNIDSAAALSSTPLNSTALSSTATDREAAPLARPETIDLLQTDLRSASLDRYKKELDERAARLQEASDAHQRLVAEFKKTTEAATKESEEASLMQIKEILEALDPALAKEQIVTMMAKELKDEVLAIIQVLDTDKLKKILGEFTDIADQERIAELLDDIRARGKLSFGEPASP